MRSAADVENVAGDNNKGAVSHLISQLDFRKRPTGASIDKDNNIVFQMKSPDDAIPAVNKWNKGFEAAQQAPDPTLSRTEKLALANANRNTHEEAYRPVKLGKNGQVTVPIDALETLKDIMHTTHKSMAFNAAASPSVSGLGA